MNQTQMLPKEWEPIHDANGRLLFELSLVTGAIRIRRRDLTTVVDVNCEREKRLRAHLSTNVGASR